MLLLRSSARVNYQAETRVVVELDANEVTLEGAAAVMFRKLLPRLNGNAPIVDLAAAIGESAERVSALTQRLESAGVLIDPRTAREDGPMSGEQFYSLHRRCAARWLRPVYDHPFWGKVVNGTATRAQVLGFAFEKYHYIEAAHEHMALAAANATPEMMPHLARHFIEEFSHGDIYRKGLRSLFSDQAILHSQPLPSTRALINFLNESATRSSFGYYAGNELLQMTENADEDAVSAVSEFYTAMRAHYPFSGKLVDSFIAHTNADQKLGHENVFAQMCASVPPLSPADVKLALNITRSMAEHLRLFMDGIDEHYARFPSLPRLPAGFMTD